MIVYTKLETRTKANNQASTQLVNLIFWWESLNFVERKMAKHKNMLVSTTKAAAHWRKSSSSSLYPAPNPMGWTRRRTRQNAHVRPQKERNQQILESASLQRGKQGNHERAGLYLPSVCCRNGRRTRTGSKCEPVDDYRSLAIVTVSDLC